MHSEPRQNHYKSVNPERFLLGHWLFARTFSPCGSPAIQTLAETNKRSFLNVCSCVCIASLLHIPLIQLFNNAGTVNTHGGHACMCIERDHMVVSCMTACRMAFSLSSRNSIFVVCHRYEEEMNVSNDYMLTEIEHAYCF